MQTKQSKAIYEENKVSTNILLKCKYIYDKILNTYSLKIMKCFLTEHGTLD